MEKIFLKPESKEISIANHSKEIHSDVFSYDGGTDEPKRKLGSLFVVGSVQTAPGTIKENAAAIQSAEDKSSDVSYIINLVASLAKREYYSRANVAPKEAFSSALKKINDVVEEFFKTKDIKLNIGIFAVAGENIHISKLGKFKILLAREDRIIDILNNIDLFSKEIMPEREFSHIVSGKISPRDKIFAYYPAQPLMTREKTLKESLLKLDGEHFLNKLNDIKKARENFSCTAVYINLNEVKEPASLPKIKPREMEEKVILADASEQGDSRLAVRNTAAGAPPKENRDTVERAESPTSNRFAVSPSAEVLPQIIPAEFSLGKKINPAFVLMNKITNFFPRPRNKIVFFVSNIGLLLVALLAIKFFFITSPEEKAAFDYFDTPNKLAIALSSEHKQEKARAEKAMRSIFHVQDSYWKWFDNEQYYHSRLCDIFFIGFQENLSEDFDLLKLKLGLPKSPELPTDDIQAHKNPEHLDKTLEERAIENLKNWYKQDYAFINLCKGIAERINKLS